jgi:preprotein translocase subunit Sec63
MNSVKMHLYENQHIKTIVTNSFFETIQGDITYDEVLKMRTNQENTQRRFQVSTEKQNPSSRRSILTYW